MAGCSLQFHKIAAIQGFDGDVNNGDSKEANWSIQPNANGTNSDLGIILLQTGIFHQHWGRSTWDPQKHAQTITHVFTPKMAARAKQLALSGHVAKL